MRQFVVSEAPVSRVARHVREVVEEAGGIVAHHTSRKTEFDHLDHGEQAWRRAGYVGTYQRFKEKPVQVRIRVWAQWPRRLLSGSVYLGFALAILFFALSIIEAAIPPNVWIFTALPILAVIATAFLMYTSSLADSRGAEQKIEAMLMDRLRADEEIPGEIYDVEDWEAYRETLIDEAREEARQQAPDGGSTFGKAASSLKSSITGAVGSEEASEEPLAEDEPPATEAETQDEDPPTDEDEGLVAKAKGLLGADGDEEPDEQEGEDAADAAPEDETEDEGPGTVARLKAKLGLGEDGAEEAEDEKADEPTEEETASEDRAEGAEDEAPAEEEARPSGEQV